MGNDVKTWEDAGRRTVEIIREIAAEIRTEVGSRISSLARDTDRRLSKLERESAEIHERLAKIDRRPHLTRQAWNEILRRLETVEGSVPTSGEIKSIVGQLREVADGLGKIQEESSSVVAAIANFRDELGDLPKREPPERTTDGESGIG